MCFYYCHCCRSLPLAATYDADSDDDDDDDVHHQLVASALSYAAARCSIDKPKLQPDKCK